MKKPESIKNLKSITVKTRAQAWQKVGELFPATEWDRRASENAGYDIYKGWLDNSGSYIADLNSSIEINYLDGDAYFETFKIWIDTSSLMESALREAQITNKLLEKEIEALKAQIAELKAIH